MEATQKNKVKAREYETIYILRPDATKESQERIASRFDEVVQREGGALAQFENWGRRQLAYGVSKYKRGVYVYVKYIGSGTLVNELERNLRVFDDVLKYQTVLLRRELDLASLQINAGDAKFEAVDTAVPDEPEETIERQLGFEQSPEKRGESAPDDDEEGEFGDVPGEGAGAEDEES